jgi:hypothetical protein
VVHAVIPAPPPPALAPFGLAEYMKVFYTENAGPVELNDMVHGNPNVPNDSETEIEWFLLQRGLNDELDSGQEPGAAADSVVRRYEFYKYVGPYDSDGQALCEDPTTPGCESSLGNYIGSQMAGVNLVPNSPGPVPEPGTFVLMGAALVGTMFIHRRFRSKPHL